MAAVQTIDAVTDAKDAKRQRISEHFGAWDGDDVKTMQEMAEERADFSKNKVEP